MQIGTKLRKATYSGGYKLMHWCPGCDGPHGIQIEGPGPKWTFNGNYDSPTFAPSIRCFTIDDEDDNGNPCPPREVTLCHYFINDGVIQFCGDSPHKFAGQNVPLPDWPYAKGTYGGLDE